MEERKDEIPKRERWLRQLFQGAKSPNPYFYAALKEIRRQGDEITPGSVFDEADSPTNICFVKCKELGFPGAAFLRQEPKKIIFLCEEYFDSRLRDGEYTEMTEIVTHEMIHWIDVNRGMDFSNQESLFCSEIRAALLSGQCQEFYNGTNTLLKTMLNHPIKCAKDRALDSMSISGSKMCCPSETLLQKCVKDIYPWTERPTSQQKAKEILVRQFQYTGNL